MRVLVTRPAGDAEDLARRVEALGAEAVVFPLTSIETLPMPPVAWDTAAAIIATSKNALRALEGAQLAVAARLPLFCTGKGTAGAARTLGFQHVHEGPGTAAGLPDVIAHSVPPGERELIYLAGEDIAFDMESALAARGYRVRKIVCYKAAAAAEFNPAVLAEFRAGRIGAVILMSPRASKLFDSLISASDLRGTAAKLRAFCLSEAVARALVSVDAAGKRVAERPDVDSLLALLRNDMMQDGTTVSQY